MVSSSLVDVLDRIKDNVVALDNNFNITYANKAYADIFGYEPSQIIGKNIWQLNTKAVGTIIYDKINEAMKDKKIRVFEWNGVYVKGYWETTIFPSENGSTIVSRDITKRKKAEEALRESEQRLRFHAENIPLAVIEWDSNFVVTRWTGDAERIFGWNTSETIGKPIMDLHMIYEPDIPIVEKTMARLTCGEIKVVSFNRNITKDGKVIYCTWYNSVLLDENGKMVSVFSFVEDDTARVTAEKALEENNKNLERLVEKRTKQLKDAEHLAGIGETARMVGHDIRNPLQAIAGDLYLIDNDVASFPEGTTKKSLQESVKAVEDNLMYIAKIIEDLQDYAKVIRPNFEKIDFEKALSEVLLLVPIADNLQVIIDIEKNLPDCTADYSMLKRVLTNLVHNAVQAMPNGGKLTIRAYHGDSCVSFSVEDTGVGIPEEVKPKLFQPMFTTKAKGQGLGLAVVKRLVEGLNGSITFESEEGKGTKFIVQLPC